jgi:exopolysaccharide biosynthesis polyprenyl glycosylphosphotransferase
LLLSVAFIGDLFAIGLGLCFAYWVRFDTGIHSFEGFWWTSGSARLPQSLSNYLGLFILGAFILLADLFKMNFYQDQNLLRFRPNIFIVTRSVVLWMFVYTGVSLAIKLSPPISRIFALLAGVFIWIFLVCWRVFLVKSIRAFGFHSWLIKRVAFLGWTDAVDRIFRSIKHDSCHVYSIVGIILETPSQKSSELPASLPVLGNASNLPKILGDRSIDILVRADGPWEVSDLVAISNLCDRELVQFKLVPSRLHSMIAGLHLETISDVPVLGVVDGPLSEPINRALKRAMDIVGAIVGLAISAPVLCLFGSLVYIESPGPIIYSQTRTGRRGKTFKIFKIRSMRLDAEARGGAQWAKKGDDRRLKIGAFMRKNNIDEVPQFWNVLKGEMSLVGPRPERPELITRFRDEIPHYNARHTVRPGMTGWAQIHGLRGDTDLTERVRYDLYYIENWTLLGDFWIMLKTFQNRQNAH